MVWLTILAQAAYGAVPQKPFIGCNREELVRAVPELSNIQFDSNQGSLDEVLRATGESLANMFEKSADISAAEEINEMRFEDIAATSRREKFRYEISLLPPGRLERFKEQRIDATTKAPLESPSSTDFLVVSHFFKLLNYLDPQYHGQARFRYVGRWISGGQDSFVIAFAQRPDGNELQSHIQVAPDGQTAHMQGLAWIDTAPKRVVRLRLDLLPPVKYFAFETLTTDISLAAVALGSTGVFWLPVRVTVHARFTGGEFHSVHRYSDYESNGEKGAVEAAPTEEDAYELTVQGITSLQTGQSGDAIASLRGVLRLNLEIPSARFNLAKALLASGDVASAEAELREVVKLLPDSGIAHNSLGIVLGKRGAAIR